MKFLIIATGYNCQNQVETCIKSIADQTHTDWDAVIIDDASQDMTGPMIEWCLNEYDGNFHHVIAPENIGAAKHRFDTIRNFPTDPNTVVLLLGLDDSLTPDALEVISKQYIFHGAWMTYGNWQGTNGYKLPDGFIHYSDSIHAQRYYRSVKFRATAPNTFYAHLFKHFVEDDFKFEGEWIKATTESNLMISLLEMCGRDRIGVIDEVIYIYFNTRIDAARHRFGSDYQRRIYKWVVQQPQRELL